MNVKEGYAINAVVMAILRRNKMKILKTLGIILLVVVLTFIFVANLYSIGELLVNWLPLWLIKSLIGLDGLIILFSLTVVFLIWIVHNWE